MSRNRGSKWLPTQLAALRARVTRLELDNAILKAYVYQGLRREVIAKRLDVSRRRVEMALEGFASSE